MTSSPSVQVHRPRRGMALLMVMAVVTMAAIIAYASLGQAALDMQSNNFVRARAEARAASANGVALASHLLLHPDENEESVVGHYPGTGGEWIALGDSSELLIDVQPHAGGRFTVTSEGRSTDGQGQTVTTSTVAELQAMGHWKAQAALMLSRSAYLSNKIDFMHGVAINGYLTGAASIDGPIIASNYTEFSEGEALPPSQVAIVPPPESLDLVQAGRNGGHFVHNGTMKQGFEITSSTLVTWPVGSGRVFFYNQPTPLRLASPTSLTIEDTLVILDGGLIVEGDVEFKSTDGMPALINLGPTRVIQSPLGATGELRCHGVTWLNGDIQGSGNSIFESRGALLIHDNQTTFSADGFARFEGRSCAHNKADSLTYENIAFDSIVVESRTETDQ